ncbi:hypothetical protein [Nonomuraea cavernae]|uniref:Uncharacterized protein n=1 Tax=Nonomuraea cavernae TaxID=2045107 RepID=A0A917Z0D2_9ACTN|nr:hypothetical protein [Nonomuraea cavernae]MCA2185808.1 hypothetical protein [Nonomuraea cavernae]GGO69544.1 hypothetical protein GCM10012289_30940 [Nonomuraea cavernae]
MTRDGFAFQSGGFTDATIYLESAAQDLGTQQYAGNQVSLGMFALSAACEWPARHEFMNTWEDVKQEFRHGANEAMAIADRLKKTEAGYNTAESTNADTVLAAVAESRRAKPAEVPTSYWNRDLDGFEVPSFPSFPWSPFSGAAVTSTSLIARAGVAWEKEAALFRKVDQERALRLWRHSPDYARELSKIAERSQATLRNLTYAKAFCYTAAAAGLAWVSMVVPSDEDLDRAIAGWDSIAYYCGEIFGHDTRLVREAIAASWDGLAKDSARRRLVEFIAAGNHLTERTGRLSAALSDTVRDLNRIHLIALTFSGVSLAAIAGAGIAARFNPALRPVIEFRGTRLSSVILSCVQFIPVAAAGALAWHRAADASRPTTIGDREISGFRRP